jgi:type III secretory pathway component EscR
MVQVRISLLENYERKIRKLASEFEISFSDMMNEMVEWTLDQEAVFRKYLEEELEKEEKKEFTEREKVESEEEEKEEEEDEESGDAEED